MKHSFIDKYSGLDSPLHRLDARLRLIGAIVSIFIMVSVPRGQIEPLVLYLFLIMGLVWISRIPPRYLLSRCLIAAPFILISAAFYPLSVLWKTEVSTPIDMHGQMMIALSIMMKAFLSVIMITLLVSTGRIHDLLHGMRSMKVPRLIGVLSAMMYRYIFIIYDETLRTTRARDSRTPGRMIGRKTVTYGNQASVIFIRSWDRSQLVYQAMLSRGFKGEFPVRDKPPLPVSDVLLSALFIVLLLAVRFAMHTPLIRNIFNV